MPPFDVGTDGAIFRLSAYENSRKDLTREFEHRMPAMITFVNDWLCIHKPVKKGTGAPSQQSLTSFRRQKGSRVRRKSTGHTDATAAL
jgi:hypothetical protein